MCAPWKAPPRSLVEAGGRRSRSPAAGCWERASSRRGCRMNGPRSWERRNHRRRSSCANFIASVIVGSGIVLPKAWIALRRGRLDMNVLATPVSFVAALDCAARQGVLVKGASYLEVASRLKAIALDKTGTLTVGRPEAKAVVAWSGHTKREVVEIAAAIDARSQHPLAEAIVRHAESLGLRPQPADDFQSFPAKERPLCWLASPSGSARIERSRNAAKKLPNFTTVWSNSPPADTAS